MARPKSPHPTEGELEILNALWDSGPLELNALCLQLRQSRQVATTTVATMLKIMVEKGLVARNPGPRGSLWAALVTKTATQKRLVTSLLDRVFEGSAQMLVSHLLDAGTLSERERKEVLELLNQVPRSKAPRKDSTHE